MSVGSKYFETRNLNIKEIAKLIRKDLKKAFPKVKFSVRTDTFPGGQAIDVVIKRLPEGMEYLTPEYREACQRGEETNSRSFITSEYVIFENRVKEIVNAYNYDHSDVQTDYFDVNFYAHVNIDYDLRYELTSNAKK